MTERETLKLALEALETLHDENMDYLVRNKLGGENNQCMVFARDVIKSIKRSLAQPEQKPVQWGVDWGKAGETPCVSIIKRKPNGGIEVVAVEYGPPPQRTWVGLTDEEIQYCVELKNPEAIAEEVEAKLKEKNT